jgi:hypothetical protein
MTTIIHNVSRVTSAGSSEELAESSVNILLGWQPTTQSHREETRRELSKHQVATRRLSHLFCRCSAARTNVVFTNSYVDNNSSLISE